MILPLAHHNPNLWLSSPLYKPHHPPKPTLFAPSHSLRFVHRRLLNPASIMAGTGVFKDIIDQEVYKYYADGEWLKSSSGKSVPIVNPTTRKPEYKVQGIILTIISWIFIFLSCSVLNFNFTVFRVDSRIFVFSIYVLRFRNLDNLD